MRADENPFATERVIKVLKYDPEWVGTSWEVIWDRWEEIGRRGALIGRHGAGKTTFLDAWVDQLRGRGFKWRRYFLNGECRNLSEEEWSEIENYAGSEVMILDGEEQLSWLQRRRFEKITEDGAGCLVTRHRRGRGEVLLEFDPNIEVLYRCVDRLAPEMVDELRPELPRMWKEHYGNLREVFLACYDYCGEI